MWKYLYLWPHVFLAFGLCPSLLGQGTPTPAPAKPDYAQEAFVVEQFTSKLAFENDGTSTREISSRIRIQSDAGVQHWGLLNFAYASSVEDVAIDYIRVRKPDGTMVATPPENIQDMPSQVTREAPFYSDLREKQVVVKGLGTGNTLEYQAHWHLTKPLAPGQFWYAYNFTHDSIVLEERLQINVPRERAVRFKSPEVQPAISEEGARRVYTWTGSNLELKPKDDKDDKAARQAVQGRFPAPQVMLSSFQSWDEVGRWYGGLQQERVKPTPEIVTKVAELTKGATDDDAKIRAIYNYVSLQFRYIGIAFGIGRYQPHSATEVLANQYGDCKDKHTLLAALLQAAGITAHPALISTAHEIDQDVPSPAQFDHVISAVPRGKDFLWLDTTAEVAPLSYLVPPIRDKHALVISPDKPAMFAATPADPPFDSLETFKIDAKLGSDGVLEGKIERGDRGDLEVALRAAFRKLSRTQWKELVQNISYASGFAGDVSEVTASLPETTSTPFEYSYSYHRKDYPNWENRQISAPLPPLALPAPGGGSNKSASSIWLGSRREITLRARVELPKGYRPELPANINLTRDFGEYHASYSIVHGALVVERRLATKIREVAANQSEQYKAFWQAVASDHDRFIELSSGSSSSGGMFQSATEASSAVRNLPDSDNAEAMRFEKEARQAALRGEVQGMITFLKRAVTADPKFTRVWLELAGMYLATRQTSAGVQAARQAVAVDPKQPLPHKILGFALMDTNQYEEAVGNWQDLAKLDPGDIDAAANLGLALLRLHRYAEAVAAFEAAIKLNENRPSLQINLGTACLRAGDQEKALAAFRKAIELEPSASTENDVAYELAESGGRLADALQYAERAVREEEEASHGINMEQLQTEDLDHVRNLAMYWDTLGWVHFRSGQLGSAEKYLDAAWSLIQDPVVADHLGQVYEQQKKTPAAAHMYRLALAASASGERSSHADMADVRNRLNRLAQSSPQKTAGFHDEAREELGRLRTFKLSRLIPGSASADFFVLFAPGSKIEEVRFLSGSEELRSAEKNLRAIPFHIPFPDDGPTRLLRRGMLTCFKITGCTFVLLTADSVHSVK